MLSCSTPDELADLGELPGRTCDDACEGRCDAIESATGERLASLCAPPCDYGSCAVLGGVCDGDGVCVVPCDDAPCLWELECYPMGDGRRCLRSEAP